MFVFKALVCCIAFKAASGVDLTFPPGFKFGVASAAYQVEGAWNVSDKSESIWDHFTHERPESTSDRSNGDVACDSYRLWRRDVQMIKEMGADFYRFSISWPRLLPNGFSNKISEDGMRYYNDLIDGLLENGIKPVVTLYHWDLPQSLQDLGGWTNPLISDWFADYARVVYSLYADRVSTWITINEAVVVCDVTYDHGTYAPGIVSPEIGAYLCNKNILMAHAKAYRIYDEEFRHLYNGKVSLANQLIWFDPLTPENEELAELVRENMVGRYSHPIYSESGGWPPSIEEALRHNALRQGYSKSNLPEFTDEEREFVKGTYDFYGLNHYTSRLVRKAHDGEVLGPFPLGDVPDLDAKLLTDPNWKTTSSAWFFVYPEGLRKQLAWVKKRYGDLDILITENGCANAALGLQDDDRVDFYSSYLEQLLLSIKEDGVNVFGYTAWTLMDNFEWTDGYQSKFGLYEVDFTSENRTRTQRASGQYYSSVIKAKSLNIDFEYKSKN